MNCEEVGCSAVPLLVTDQWFGRPRGRVCLGYVITRGILWLAYTILFIFNIGWSPKDQRYFFIYLTNWGSMLILLRETLSFYLTLRYYRLQESQPVENQNQAAAVMSNTSRNQKRLGFLSTLLLHAFQVGAKLTRIINRTKEPGSEFAQPNGALQKLSYLVNNVSTAIAFEVTVFYWAKIWDPSERPLDFFNFFEHIFNSIISIIDIVLSAQPFKFMDFVQAVLFGIAYTVFSLIHFFMNWTDENGNRFIYAVMDWQNPVQALTVVVVNCILIFLSHQFAMVLDACKRFLASKFELNSRI